MAFHVATNVSSVNSDCSQYPCATSRPPLNSVSAVVFNFLYMSVRACGERLPYLNC